MANNFLPHHASVQNSITLIDKTEHIAFFFSLILTRNTGNLGEQKEVIHFNLLNRSLCNYGTSFSRTSCVVYSLFLIYAMADDIVYTDIKTVRAFPLEHSSPLPQSGKLDLGLLLKINILLLNSFISILCRCLF